MKLSQRVRLVALSFAVVSLVGVMAVMACAPPAAPPNGAGNVSDSVSVPTEAPFVLPQSGDGSGTADPTVVPTETPIPTATRYVPPTADRSLCRKTYNWGTDTVIGTRCPPDGHPAVSNVLRNKYNAAMREIEALEAKGETGEFPDLRIMVFTNTDEAVDDVVNLLVANGAREVRGYPAPDQESSGSVYGTVSIEVVPQLADVDGVVSVDWQKDRTRLPRPVVEETRLVARELREKYGDARHANAGRTARGQAEIYPVVRVSITAWLASDVDRVVEFLKANGGKNITWAKEENDGAGKGSVEGDISLGLIDELAWFTGVKRIEEVQPTSKVNPGPSDGSGGGGERAIVLPPAFVSSAVLMQANQWHRAGFTGSGVEVAVIDVDFSDFGTRILPLLSSPVHFLCYRHVDTPVEGYVPVEGTLSMSSLANGGDPAGSFSACERPSTSGGSPHGTDVVQALLGIAPDVKIYIANPNLPSRRVEVLRWLTGGLSDNEPPVAHYTVASNDDFDVRVIGHSVVEGWAGPGDGTSPFDDYTNRSLLRLVEDAVQKGVLWVNSAGNTGAVTWFKRVSGSDFIQGNDRVLKFDRFGTHCNDVSIAADESHSFFLRWTGPWPGATTNLDLVLLRRSGSTFTPVSVMNDGNDVQAGTDEQYPAEDLEVGVNEVGAGDYCLGVRWVSGLSPSWVQLQVFSGSSGLRIKTGEGSLTDPGDSKEDGMLSVGAVHHRLNDVADYSARGPAPEPYTVGPPQVERIALDLVSDGTHVLPSITVALTFDRIGP